MSKSFFEVFPSLQLNTDIRDLMGQTEVERVSAFCRILKPVFANL